MPAWVEPYNPVTSVSRVGKDAVASRKQAKGFLDGIPKGVWFLAGYLAPDLLRRGHGRKT